MFKAVLDFLFGSPEYTWDDGTPVDEEVIERELNQGWDTEDPRYKYDDSDNK